MNYSQEEMIKMVYTLGESHGNCLLAARMYAQKFPERRHPQEICFRRLKERFERTGSVKYEKTTRNKTVLNEENELAIALSVTEDPTLSVRAISQNLNIRKSSVGKSLQSQKFHPYHLQLHQELTERDFANRVSFCQWAQQRIRENPLFFKFVLFSDESTFHRNGFVNRHNFHFYAMENPRAVQVANYQHRWSLNVWGGILHNYVIGPYFFEQSLTGNLFWRFLQEQLPGLIAHVPEDIKQNLLFQLDGAPAHFHQDVRACLNETFPERWIGRGGPIHWPARSPDLTSMDFFLWGYIKSVTYRTPATTRDDMKQRITDAFRSVTPVMLSNIRDNFIRRLDACIGQNGGHFEQFM